MPSFRRRAAILTLPLLLASGLAACGKSENAATATTTTTSRDASKDTNAEKLRLGYFPNVTHAVAINGVEKGIFAEKLGNTKLETVTFNAGPAAIEAVFGDALDATFIGPNPAINAYAKAKGDGGAIRIVSGAASGGAFLVVKPEINSAADLKGKSLATPQLGGTQDVALRAWLKEQGLNTDTSGGGDVSVKPQENADTLNAFKTGDIAGAWVPEPWATRLINEGSGKVLVDEKTLWPNGKFVTTHLIVTTKYLDAHPDAVKKLLEGVVASAADLKSNPDAGRKTVNDGIGKVTGKPLPEAVISAAWPNIEFTVDPVASSLQKSADDAKSLGLLKDKDLDLKKPGIYDLTLLNEVLKAAGQPTVNGL